jgi:hypothetical protein
MSTNDWRIRLGDGDPAREARLDPAAAAHMRRRVLAAVQPAFARAWAWPPPVTVAATVALMIGAGAAAGLQLPMQEPVPESAPSRAAREAADRTRQLQFSTPGGTRIIWVFDPQFTLKETMP